MSNIFEELYEIQSLRCNLYAQALGVAKGCFTNIKKYPEDAYETADKALELLEELSNQIYKRNEDAKI